MATPSRGLACLKLVCVLSCISALVLVSTGCDTPKNARASGKVTLDGSPLDRGTVAFYSENDGSAPAATGTIQADGSYNVQIGQSGRLWVGEYAVCVTAMGPSVPDPQGGPPTPGELITPQRYSKVATSGLRFNVRPGDNVIDIVLVSPKDAAEPAAETGAEQDTSESTDSGDSDAEQDTPSEEGTEAAEPE